MSEVKSLNSNETVGNLSSTTSIIDECTRRLEKTLEHCTEWKLKHLISENLLLKKLLAEMEHKNNILCQYASILKQACENAAAGHCKCEDRRRKELESCPCFRCRTDLLQIAEYYRERVSRLVESRSQMGDCVVGAKDEVAKVESTHEGLIGDGRGQGGSQIEIVKIS